jgi:hypothetical protein
MAYCAGAGIKLRRVVAWDFDDTIKHTIDPGLFGRVPEKAFCVEGHPQYAKYQLFCERGHINVDDITPHIAWYKLTFAILKNINVTSVLATQRLFQVTEDEPNLYQRNMQGCYAYLDMIFGAERSFLKEISDAERSKMYSGAERDSINLKSSYLKYYAHRYVCTPEQIVLVDDNVDYMAPVLEQGNGFILADNECSHLVRVLEQCVGSSRLYTEIAKILLPKDVTEDNRKAFVDFIRTFDANQFKQIAFDKNNFIVLILKVKNAMPFKRQLQSQFFESKKAQALNALRCEIKSLKEKNLTEFEVKNYLKILTRIACTVTKNDNGPDTPTAEGSKLLSELQTGLAYWRMIILPSIRAGKFGYDDLVKFSGSNKKDLSNPELKDKFYRL